MFHMVKLRLAAAGRPQILSANSFRSCWSRISSARTCRLRTSSTWPGAPIPAPPRSTTGAGGASPAISSSGFPSERVVWTTRGEKLGNAAPTPSSELSLDPGDPHAVVHHVFAQHSILCDGLGFQAFRHIVRENEPRKEEAPGKPDCLLFLLLVTGEECNAVEPFETRETVAKNNVGNLMGDVAVPPCSCHQRIVDDGVAPAGKFERAGKECIVLDTLEFFDLLYIDECVCGANDAAYVPGEVHRVHPIAGLAAHRAPDVPREALGFGFESTAESQRLFLVQKSVVNFL